MALNVSTSEEKEYTPVPEETYIGVCVGIVDLGKQFNQKYKVWRKKVVFMWELPDERAIFEFEGTEYNYPRVVSRQFGLTLSRKGHLRPMLEQWSGKQFAKEGDIDLFGYMGQAGLVQVVHNTSGERTYANVASVGKLMKGMESPKQETPPIKFSFAEHDTLESVEDALQDFPDWVEWMVNAIRESAEYENLQKRAQPNLYGGEDSVGITADEAAKALGGTVEDVPF